ncbi:uncharacterized protein [Procambarus clarkii]|uniref:uncharacterized protein isoform X2 n=1 Tax=Procambarus clarkii TaxID=6728 RepID=UPI0037430CA5
MGRKSNRRHPLAGVSKKTSMSQKLKAVATKPWQCDFFRTEERISALHENSRFSDLTITFPGHQDVMQRLQEQLTADNLPEMYDTCVLFEDTSLLHKCTKILQVYSSDVLTSPHIGELSQNSFRHILQQKLNISSEVTVFNAVVLWGKAQLRKGTEDRDSLRQVTEELLIHVRFLTMTTDEMTEYVLPTGILTPEETSAILLNIKNVKNVKLPAEFSRNRKKRNVCFDRSFLRTITFKPNNKSMKSSYQKADENFVEDLTVSRVIYLKSIVDHGNILHNNSEVTIEGYWPNTDGDAVVETGRVINRAVEFKKPVKLTKDSKYIISAKQENSEIRKNHCCYEYEPSTDGSFEFDSEPEFEFDSDSESCVEERDYTYSNKNGNVVLKGNFLIISEGLTFHYFCLDN